MVRDLDLWPPHRIDNRILEVVADGLRLHGGAQLAIDTTLVSALTRDGTARPGADRHDGVALRGLTKADLHELDTRGVRFLIEQIQTISDRFSLRSQTLMIKIDELSRIKKTRRIDFESSD